MSFNQDLYNILSLKITNLEFLQSFRILKFHCREYLFQSSFV